MLVTSREQKLIHAFLKNGNLTISEMLELTGTSRRTLYRDLERLQQSLPADVSLQTSDEGYFLAGELSVLTQMHELVEFTAQERLYGELLLLFTNRASIISISDEFGISQPTATADLRMIEKMLLENELLLEREHGLRVSGSEEKIRSIMTSALYQSTSIAEILKNQFQSNKILKLIDLSQIEQARAIFDRIDLPEITDKALTLMQCFLAVSLLRLQQNQTIDSNNKRRPSKQALTFVQGLARLLPMIFSISEITYLAMVYDTLYFGFGRDVLFIEKFDTDFSYKIRQLIVGVSEQTGLPFGKDDHLYGLLYAHLKDTDILPTLFEVKQDEFITSVEENNPNIIAAVKTHLTQVFGKNFSMREVAFVALHFLATLERSDLVMPLRAALVTSRGFISCEFLMSNLKKNFPFLRKIDLIQTTQDFDKSYYDAVFTTEKELDYIYVNLNLEHKNLDEIRHQLRMIQQNTSVRADDNQKNIVNLNQLFTISTTLINSFSIDTLDNLSVLTETIRSVVSMTQSTDKAALRKLLEKRFEETHLAIPETKIGLFHAVHESIETPLFKIYDLNQEVEVIGMNRKKMKIKRVLLLLSPPSVSTYATYLLGKISSSIIENKLYTTIYDSGNEAVVKELLRQIMTEAIRKYGE